MKVFIPREAKFDIKEAERKAAQNKKNNPKEKEVVKMTISMLYSLGFK